MLLLTPGLLQLLGLLRLCVATEALHPVLQPGEGEPVLGADGEAGGGAVGGAQLDGVALQKPLGEGVLVATEVIPLQRLVHLVQGGDDGWKMVDVWMVDGGWWMVGWLGGWMGEW